MIISVRFKSLAVAILHTVVLSGTRGFSRKPSRKIHAQINTPAFEETTLDRSVHQFSLQFVGGIALVYLSGEKRIAVVSFDDVNSNCTKLSLMCV